MIRIQFLQIASLMTLSLVLCACSGGFKSAASEEKGISQMTSSPPITLPMITSSSPDSVPPSSPSATDPTPHAPPVTQALLLTNPDLTVQAGQTLTLTTQFNATPMKKDYSVFIHFIDPSGSQQSSINGDYTPAVSTRQWSGLVQYTRSIAIPATLPTGKYTIKVGLFENVAPYNNRPSLALSPGVTVDNQIRYIVGSVTITAPPKPQPPPAQVPVPQPGGMAALTPSGPITLESNRTYSGLRITNPNGPCVYGNQVSNVRITNSEIGPCGDGTNSEQVGIIVHSSTNIRIDHNVVHDVASGIAAVSSTAVTVDHNHISKIRGPFPSGHIILFDKLYGAGNKMLCNVGDNSENDGTEDNVNTWMSHGVPESPIEIAYNRIRGGHSKSGTGINIGDGGSDYVDVHDNTIVNVNNAGIGVSSGNFLKIRNNKVYNNGPYSSVGISVRNWYDGCSNIEVSGNRVWAFDHIWGMNSVWNYLNTGECSNVTESGNSFGDTSLSAEIYDQPYPECE